MASDEITRALRSPDYLRRYFEATGREYVTGRNVKCPNVGAHKNGDANPSAKIYEDASGAHIKCFGCGFQGDIFALWQLDNGGTFAQAKAALCAMFGIEQDKGHTSGAARSARTGAAVATPSRGAARPAATQNAATIQDEKPDTATQQYITTCAIAYKAGQDAAGREYMHGRGISDETAQRFGIGFDAKRQAVIIPYGCGYAMRFLKPLKRKDGGEIKAMYEPKGKPRTMFNAAALAQAAKDGSPVFIVEGEIDALSIAEVGGVAVSIGGTGGASKIVNAVKNIGGGVYIPCADRDEAGEKAQGKLEAELSEIDGAAVFTDAPRLLIPNRADGTHPKDANEALQEDRAGFTARVARIIEQAKCPFNRTIGSGENAILLRRFCDIPPTPEQEQDPNALIKGAKVAALSKGEGWIIAGEPGAGKSSFAQQFMFCAGAGKACFGFEFARPLHILYLQSELQNHKLRLAENSLVYGLRTAFNWTDEEISRARENVVYDELSIGKVCEDLAAHITRIFAVYPFDLLVIDPLITFAEGDLSLQKDAKAFFKDVWRLIGGRAFKVNGNPVKFGVIILHHMGKDNLGKDGKKIEKGQFATAGSYVINAWARYQLNLRKIGKGVYALQAVKNAEDGASWKNAEGEFTDTFYIKRAGRGERYWTAATSEEISEAKQGDAPTMTAEEKRIKKQEEDGERASKGLNEFLEYAKSESENGRHLCMSAARNYCRTKYGRTLGDNIYSLFDGNRAGYHFKLSKPQNGKKYFIYAPDAPKLEIQDEPTDTPSTSKTIDEIIAERDATADVSQDEPTGED